MTRAGIVTVAGKPNAGKSTLLNRLVGEKLAITSPKAQSTRHRVVGLRTEQDTQMVVLDTPGLLDPRDLLHQAMRGASLSALRDADVIVYVVDASAIAPHALERWLEQLGTPIDASRSDADREILRAAGLERVASAAEPVGPPWPSLEEAAALEHSPRAPVLVALNKSDVLPEALRLRIAECTTNVRLLSALTGDGIDALVTDITERLPESPYLYPADEVSTQPMRFFCAEFVRETAMEQLGDELPHALACAIEEYREGSTPLYIRAVLYVERDSQKAIVIGAGGQQIKKLGRVARQKIEAFVGEPVYLDLWVKVLANWRKKRGAVSRLGYGDPNARPSA
jgi:GTP-binding protein Era